MSHSFRPPAGAGSSVPVVQTSLPARMIAPICTTASPAVYSMIPNAYDLLPQQPQHYVPHPMVYPQSMANVANRTAFMPAVPSNMTRMFVPVAPVHTGISTSITDPAKLLEEQRKLEKERNFQLQQERLKQFTISGKKSNINPDNLIDSMFGKIQCKKNSSNPSPVVLPPKTNDRKALVSKSKSCFEKENLGNDSSLDKSSTLPGFSETVTTVPLPVKKDIKELDSMMLECSNLNAPSKAVQFQKPSVKEITPSSGYRTTFAASEKSRDWRDLKGLDEVFTTPKSRFPDWCVREKVPDLYKKVHSIVTNNDLHAPDTNLLFPILVSSGLTRELLGEIWELVNESGSGQLSVEEMYAALALIAVVQVGHQVKNIAILQKLNSIPVPYLNFFQNTSNLSESNYSPPLTSEENISSNISFQQHSDQPVHQIMRPSAISIRSYTQSSNDQKEIMDIPQKSEIFTGSSNTPDDEFADFQSATPTAFNFSLDTPSSHSLHISNDDFDDFKQAPCSKVQESNILCTKLLETCIITKDQNKPVSQDLLSPEDKYSVFRVLQENENNDQWADFTFCSVSNESPCIFSKDIESSDKENSSGEITNDVVTNIHKDDEFGDFVDAVPVFTTVTDFADFSNFNQAESEQLPVSQLDDEFAEFTKCASVSMKSELGHDFSFHQIKDNISLAESQSVSSLELGTFDGGGGHSGESTSLSRQGSIPSLDLKSAVFDGTDSEDCTAEIQLPPSVPQNSKSPSPISVTKVVDENETNLAAVGQFFQSSSLPLTDKYSVIRQGKLKDEDQHVNCWTQCLDSALNILQSMQKIFNQMSCSSVCNEVLSSEEGGNYVKNVIEIYKVTCQIGLACKSLGKQTQTLLDLLNETDQVWSTLCGFFAGSSLMPDAASLDFASSILKPEPENNGKACGLCLLNIELQSRSFKHEGCPKLSYGGRHYHSTCANFWINCVDPLLPALVLPLLL